MLLLLALFILAAALLYVFTPQLLRMRKGSRALLSTLIIASPLIVLLGYFVFWAVFVGDM